MLLAGISGHLVVCTYFRSGKMLNCTSGEVGVFEGGFLVLPPYYLLEIEATGSVMIEFAIGVKGTPMYSPLTIRTLDQLRVIVRHADEFIQFLVQAQVEAEGAAATTTTTTTETQPTPAVPAAQAELMRKTSPLRGITKAQAIDAFGRLIRTNLKSALEDAPKWIADARASKGTPGGRHKTIWCPVLLAVAFYETHRVPLALLNRVFREHDFLNDWRDEWREQAKELA